MAGHAAPPHLHMVMVPNPAYHAAGDFGLVDGQLVLDGATRWTYGNIALYRTALFAELPRGVKLQMLPLYRTWIARGWASGELYSGFWSNVGTAADLDRLDRTLHQERTSR